MSERPEDEFLDTPRGTQGFPNRRFATGLGGYGPATRRTTFPEDASPRNAIGELHHGPIRLDAEAIAKQLGVRMRGSDGAGPISGRVECSHQLYGDARVVGSEGRESLPPIGRLDDPAARRRLTSKRLHRLARELRVHLTLCLHPSIELGGVAQKEAVEERTSEVLDDSTPIARFAGSFQIGDIAPEAVVIQTQIVADRDDRIRAERAVEAIDRVGEEAAAAIRVGIRPQECSEPVAASARPTSRSEEGEERNTVALGRSTEEWPVARPYARAAEQRETVHIRDDEVARSRR